MLNKYLDPNCDLPCPEIVHWSTLIGRHIVIVEVGPLLGPLLMLPVDKHNVIVKFDDHQYGIRDLAYRRQRKIRPALIRAVHQTIVYDPSNETFYQTSFPAGRFGHIGSMGISPYCDSLVPELYVLVSPAPSTGMFDLYPVVEPIVSFENASYFAKPMPEKIPELSKLCPRHFTFDQALMYWCAIQTEGNTLLQSKIRSYLAELDIASRYVFIKRMAQHVYPQA